MNKNKLLHYYFPLGIHISRDAYDQLGIESDTSYRYALDSGSEILALRSLAERSNRSFDNRSGYKTISAGELSMMRALIDSLRFVTHLYCFENQPGILKDAVSKIKAEFGRETSEETTKKLLLFTPLNQSWNLRLKQISFYLRDLGHQQVKN